MATSIKATLAHSTEVSLCVSFYRGLFIIDRKGILRQITMNDLPVSENHFLSQTTHCMVAALVYEGQN